MLLLGNFNLIFSLSPYYEVRLSQWWRFKTFSHKEVEEVMSQKRLKAKWHHHHIKIKEVHWYCRRHKDNILQPLGSSITSYNAQFSRKTSLVTSLRRSLERKSWSMRREPSYSSSQEKWIRYLVIFNQTITISK